MAEKKHYVTYFLRLGIFAVVSLLVGVVVLILAFAPATNPGFLSSVLYRGNNHKDIAEMKKFAAMFGTAKDGTVPIFEALEKPPSDDDFKQAGVEKPGVVSFKTSDAVVLNGWYFKGSGPDTVLVCYNGFGKRLPLLVGYIKMFQAAGLSALLFDYRGFDDMAVKPTALTACIDAQAAYDYLVKTRGVSDQHLIILGRDLGSYAALKVASASKCKALVLENPWGTVKAFVDAVPGAIAMQLVPAFLYTDDCLNNVHLVGKDHPPIVVIADDPEITDAGSFYAAISPPKTFMYVEGYMPQMLAPNLKSDSEKYTARLKSLVAGQVLPSPETVAVNWQTDYKAALDQAKKSGKPLYADFGASWCFWCHRMDLTTYMDADVVARLNNDFVPVKLDADGADAKALFARYPCQGIPAVLVLDSEERLKIKLVGYLPARRLLNDLAKVRPAALTK